MVAPVLSCTLASVRVMSASVAEVNHLKPWSLYEPSDWGTATVSVPLAEDKQGEMSYSFSAQQNQNQNSSTDNSVNPLTQYEWVRTKGVWPYVFVVTRCVCGAFTPVLRTVPLWSDQLRTVSCSFTTDLHPILPVSLSSTVQMSRSAQADEWSNDCRLQLQATKPLWTSQTHTKSINTFTS